MLRQTENQVVIEGILNEVDLEEKEYSDKDTGAPVKAIAGNFVVKVPGETEAEDKYVPIQVFANQYTKAGKPHPAYASLNKLLTDAFQSIDAVGEENATKVRVTGADIRENVYMTEDKRTISYPRIHGSFVTKVKEADFQPRAIWNLESYILSMEEEMIEKDGIEVPTGALLMKVALVDFKLKANIITIKVLNPELVAATESTYNVEQLVPMAGILDFSTVNKEIVEEVEIGAPLKRNVTINISDIVFTSGKLPLSEDEGFTQLDMQQALATRASDIEASRIKAEQKAKRNEQGTKTSAPAQTDKKRSALGF